MEKKLKVLIVEDSEDDELLLRLEFKRNGYSLTHKRVEIREELISALAEMEWDIVLSDFSLPKFGGIEALEIVKEFDPDLPVILVSGTMGEDVAVDAMKRGASDYILKNNLHRLVASAEREIREANVHRERNQAQEELRKSEAELNQVFNNVEAVIFSYDNVQNKLVKMSKAAEKIYGTSLQAFYDQPTLWLDLLHPDDKQRIFSSYQNLLSGKKTSAENEIRIVRNNNETRWLRTRIKSYCDAEGKVLRLDGFLYDITEKKLAEEALREKEKHSQSLLRMSRNFERSQTYAEILTAAFEEVNRIIGYKNLWVYRLSDDKKYLKALTATGSQSGTVLSEQGTATLTIKGDRMLEEIAEAKEIVVVEDARIDERTNKEIVAAMEIRTIINIPIILLNRHLGSVGTGTFGDEGIRVPTQSEKEFLLSMASHIAVAIDRIDLLDKRKEVEEALIESEQRYRWLYDDLPIMNFTIGVDGTILSLNKFAVEQLGYSAEELIGQNVLNIFYEEDKAQVLIQVNLCLERFGELIEWQLRKVRKYGKVIWVHETARAITDTEGKTVILVACQDITERKRVEEEILFAKEKAEKSDKLKSEFLTQMSHEIRSPINVIINFTQLINETLKDQPIENIPDYLEAITGSGKRLIRTVDLILNMSELQIGTYEPNMEKMDLVEDVFLRIKFDYIMLAKQRGLELNFLCATPNKIVYGDRYSIYQIFVNLIDNAIKYTQEGEIEVMIDRDEKNNVIVSVEDTGIGISEEFMEYLFDPFMQEERGYSRRFDGNGLGLALVKRYCELNGASIFVESEKEKGSKFVVTFPYRAELN